MFRLRQSLLLLTATATGVAAYGTLVTVAFTVALGVGYLWVGGPHAGDRTPHVAAFSTSQVARGPAGLRRASLPLLAAAAPRVDADVSALRAEGL